MTGVGGATGRGLEFGPGRRGRFHYTLSLPDGTVVDTSLDAEPLEVGAGAGAIDPGLEARLHGLRAGDRVRLYLAPGEAFGWPDAEAVQDVPRGEFPPEMDLAPDLIVGFTAPSGLEVAGRILEVGEDRVRVDFNHPLAGRAFVFEVEALAVAEA